MTRLEDYADRYENLRFTREDGVLEIAMHTDGGPLVFTGRTHSDFVDAFADVARDRDNHVVILTGTGDEWMARIDFPSLGDVTKPREWDRTYWEGKKVLQNLLDVEVPVVAAVNGPALLHSEYVLTCDVVLASENAVFQDQPHLSGGIVPGDGVHVLWQEVLGTVRGRYFLLTQQTLTAKEAADLGVVNEVLPTPEALRERAWALARQLTAIPFLTRRYTRVAMTQHLKRKLLADVGYGLALEGLSAADLPTHQAEVAEREARGGATEA